MTTQIPFHTKGPSKADPQLLLREATHRHGNDLQLIVAMLSLQARRAPHVETAEALRDAAERVAILAHARAAPADDGSPSLESALGRICNALNAQAAPHAITKLRIDDPCDGLDPASIAPIMLAVNELATNSLKHAFRDEKGGHIQISAWTEGDQIVITVDDDGAPFSEQQDTSRKGLGLGLIRRLITSSGGTLRLPSHDTKLFVLTFPLRNAVNQLQHRA